MMSNERLKEILDRLDRIDHKEYSCGFEFADSGTFDEDCRCFEERKKLANYITNLQNIIDEFEKWLIGEQMMFYRGSDNERLIRYFETKNKWLELKEKYNGIN